MRWIRGFPPYCLGAVANKTIRNTFQEHAVFNQKKAMVPA